MKRSIQVTIPVAILVAVITAAGSAGWVYTEIVTPYRGAQSEETFVKIPRGMATDSIADLLVDAGILRNRIPFIIYLRFTRQADRIQAGEYRFSEPSSPRQIARRLVLGDVFYRAVTIPEGLTSMETIALLSQKGFGEKGEMQSAFRNTEWISDLAPDARNLEGYLFPDTYHFGREADSYTIIRSMVEQFRKKYVQIQKQIPMPEGWNVSRTVVLASMIEKEARKAEERPLISSVYHNRLERRIPLACDATIIYAMKLDGTWNGNIRKADLSMESPYNTYLNRGLPPGPIANPGADSLQAALKPADTEYIYYVSRNDGTHVFSKNYRDHQRAVDQYQRRR